VVIRSTLRADLSHARARDSGARPAHQHGSLPQQELAQTDGSQTPAQLMVLPIRPQGQVAEHEAP
jgi:hypothetical protein